MYGGRKLNGFFGCGGLGGHLVGLGGNEELTLLKMVVVNVRGTVAGHYFNNARLVTTIFFTHTEVTGG